MEHEQPNRVLDLILDAYEEQPLNRCFIPLIRRFKPTTAAHMLGFKFTMHHVPRVLRSSETDTPAPASAPAAAMAAKVNGSKASAPITTVAPAAAAANASNDKLIINAHKDIVGSDAPQSLYVLAAVLIMNKLVALDDLLPYLRPSLDRLAETIAAIEGGLAKQASAFGVVNLNATKPSGGKEAPLGSAANSGSNNIPVSVDATKEPVVTKVATASGRRPPLPAAPPANSGVTVLPVPPSAKAAAPSTKAVPAVKPPVPSGAPPDSKSGSTAALNRAQSSSKLHGSDKDKMDVVELVDEDAVDESKFTLFFDPAHAAESAQLATGAVESGEVVAEPECPVAVTPRAFCEGNEVVGLIAALLSVRGWQQAKYLLNLLETHGMDPLLVMKYSPDLRTAMAALVDWHVEAAYLSSGSSSAGRGFSKPVSILPVAVSLVGQPSAFKGSNAKAASIDPNSLAGLSAFLKIVPTTSEPQLQQIPSVAEFPLQSSALLSYFGYHLREYPALFARLCRLSKAYVRQLSSPTSAMVTDSTETAGNEAALEPALALISNVLLPALSAYTENNPFLAGQVWDAISGMPFVQRFALYDRWYGGGE